MRKIIVFVEESNFETLIETEPTKHWQMTCNESMCSNIIEISDFTCEGDNILYDYPNIKKDNYRIMK